MQNSISDMARFLKNIIPSYIPESYTVKAIFKHISDEENIRRGNLAFRDILYMICDRLIADGKLYDKPAKNIHNTDSHTSLSVSFPFFNNVKSILFNIGYHGELINNGEELLIDDLNQLTSTVGVDGGQMRAKISNPKLIEALRFLTECGIYFDCIDFKALKLNLSGISSVRITYPSNPVMLIGLKVMAIAQKMLYTKGNHDIFLRCDYRVIADDDTEILSKLKDFVAPLPKAAQDFCLQLHHRCVEAGLKCTTDVFYLNVRFIYSCKSKEVLTYSAAYDSGYRILIKAQNTDKYTEVIETFPLPFQEKISRGYGCNKKLFGEPCQKGCHGFSFPLDDSIAGISPYINIWLDNELSCIQRKK